MGKGGGLEMALTSVISSLNENHAKSCPMHKYKDQGAGPIRKMPIQAKHDASIAKRSPAPDLLSFAEIRLEISSMLVERMVGHCSYILVRRDPCGSQ
jgi:hypothetical protein